MTNAIIGSVTTQEVSSIVKLKTLDIEAGNQVRTVSYDDAYETTATPAIGGSLYEITTLALYRIKISDGAWVPDGTKDFYLDNGNIAVDLLAEKPATVAIMKTLDLQAGTTVETESYYAYSGSVAAKGGATYQIVTAAEFTAITGIGTADAYVDHVLTNGNVAMYIKEGTVVAYQIGAKVDGTTDDTLPIEAAALRFKTSHDGFDLLIPAGVCLLNITIPGSRHMSLKGERGGTILTSFAANDWAVTYSPGFVGAPQQALVIRDIVFDGTDKTKHGLQNNLGSNLFIEQCEFTRNGIAYLANGTISYSLTNCDFYNNYVGAYITCKTTAGSGTTITDINGQSVSILSAFFPQQPGDVDLIRCSFGLSNCDIFIEQPDNPFQVDLGIRMQGGLLQNGTCGIIQNTTPISNLSRPLVIDGTWMEGHNTTQNVTINGTSYSGATLTMYSGKAVVRDCLLESFRVYNNTKLRLENVTHPEDGTFGLQQINGSTPSVTGSNIRKDGGYIPYYSSNIVCSTTAGTSVRGCAGKVPFHNAQSYRGNVDGTRLASDVLTSGLLNNYGAPVSKASLADGILDTQLCLEVVAAAGNGVQINPGTAPTTDNLVCLVFAARATTTAFTLTLLPNGSNPIHNNIDVPLTTKWQSYAIVGRGRAGTATTAFVPKTGTVGNQTWRMSAIQQVQFATEDDLMNFLSGSEFML